MPNPSMAKKTVASKSNPMPSENLIDDYRSRTENILSQFLAENDGSTTRLHTAMQYSVLGGGKRIRPILVYATGYALDATLSHLDRAACAVEFIHAYSMIHDDLPAMDDDDLRRGKPTCHKAFDEATAILAGDALQALAFQILSATPSSEDEAKTLKKISLLASASGIQGMVGGQAIDLEAVGETLGLDQLEAMHAKKTGALIRASVLLGAYTAPNVSEVQLNQLDHFSHCIGLAFQVRDDILDVEGNTQVIGKTRGADARKGKPTYSTLLGIEKAKKVAEQLHREAIDSLSIFDERANVLREISSYIVNREK